MTNRAQIQGTSTECLLETPELIALAKTAEGQPWNAPVRGLLKALRGRLEGKQPADYEPA